MCGLLNPREPDPTGALEREDVIDLYALEAKCQPFVSPAIRHWLWAVSRSECVPSGAFLSKVAPIR